ncbi:MAG TPA: hypothetical protein VJ892_04845 [Candidatus Absconditabacterales bacterium]|nr:hypothetical protein [Candidatus Absconditabacterales bacterium]
MRKSKARKKAIRAVEKTLRIRDHNKREAEKAKRDPNYKPKFKKRKRR